MTFAPGYPGSHPHADRPNWRPAETPRTTCATAAKD
jgi:hypothetical protein